MNEGFWKRCSSCKKEIPFAATYWVCNVSTCNRRSMALAFCSVACWDAHVPVLRHRESWAIEKEAPTQGEWERETAAEVVADRERAAAGRDASHPAPAAQASAAAPPSAGAGAGAAARAEAPTAAGPDATAPGAVLRDAKDIPRDVLVVASKLKQYIRARSGMNTSDGVLEVLSDRLRSLCDQAIRRANDAGRKTVLDRDF